MVQWTIPWSATTAVPWSSGILDLDKKETYFGTKQRRGNTRATQSEPDTPASSIKRENGSEIRRPERPVRISKPHANPPFVVVFPS